jgi:hypothetical protein
VSAPCKGVQQGLSKGVEDGRRLSTLWVATPETAVRLFQGSPPAPQSIEGSGMAGHIDALGRRRPPLGMRPGSLESLKAKVGSAVVNGFRVGTRNC